MTKEIISTRPAVAEDAPSIASMQRELAIHCHYPRSFSISEDRIRSTILDSGSHDEFFIADDMFMDGYGAQVDRFHEIGGFIQIGRAPLSFTGVRGFYVDNLYVRPELQRDHAVGISLLARAAETAIEFADGNPDNAFLRLDTVYRNNDPSIRAYEGLGFDRFNTNLRLQGDAIKELASLAMSRVNS